MLTAEASEFIARSPEDVWAFAEDPLNDARWKATARKREVLTEGPQGVGTRIRGVDRFMGRTMETVFETTEWDPPRRSAGRVVSGPPGFRVESRATYEAVDGGTRVRWRAEVEGLGGVLGRFAGPVIVRTMERQFRADLGRLKHVLESRP